MMIFTNFDVSFFLFHLPWSPRFSLIFLIIHVLFMAKLKFGNQILSCEIDIDDLIFILTTDLDCID